MLLRSLLKRLYLIGQYRNVKSSGIAQWTRSAILAILGNWLGKNWRECILEPTVPELFIRGGKPDDGFSLNASSLTRRLRATLKHEELVPMIWSSVAACLAQPCSVSIIFKYILDMLWWPEHLRLRCELQSVLFTSIGIFSRSTKANYVLNLREASLAFPSALSFMPWTSFFSFDT